MLEELWLEAGDLVDEAPSFFEPSSQGHGELNSVTLYCPSKCNKIQAREPVILVIYICNCYVLSPPELPSASAASLPEDTDMAIEEDKEIDGKLPLFF